MPASNYAKRYLLTYLCCLGAAVALATLGPEPNIHSASGLRILPAVLLVAPVSWLGYIGIDSMPEWWPYFFLVLGAVANASLAWWLGRRRDRAA